MDFIVILAQQAETLGFMQAILDGGTPLLLMVGIAIVGWLYKKEKEEHSADNAKHMAESAVLREKFSDKVEELYKQRLESETENARIIMRASEALESVDGTLARTNETLDSLMED
jgi:hypothetical protein